MAAQGAGEGEGEDTGAGHPAAALNAGPPDVIAFDALETLFSLASLEPALAEAGATPSALSLWFAQLLRDGFALAVSGDYRSFRDVAGASLRRAVPDASAAALDRVLAGFAELEPHPDSAAALGRAVMGARVVVITNSSAASTRRLLARGGLDAFVETVVSAEDVAAWKPAAAPYLRAAHVTGVDPEHVAMVTVHPWDVQGAHRAGLVTAWCSRDQRRFTATFARPDVEAENLLDLVERLLGSAG